MQLIRPLDTVLGEMAEQLIMALKKATISHHFHPHHLNFASTQFQQYHEPTTALFKQPAVRRRWTSRKIVVESEPVPAITNFH
jgi:hypothetical protein